MAEDEEKMTEHFQDGCVSIFIQIFFFLELLYYIILYV